MKIFSLAILFLAFAFSAPAQTDTTAKPAPKYNPARSANSTTAKKPTSATTTAAKPVATIDTTAGKMTCTLFPDKAPDAVANFVGLATGTRDWRNPKTNKMQHGVPLYNGTIFHRVIPNFMIQGGDPLGNGTGGPGYQIKDELRADLKFDVPGRLAYANSGPNTNGSQFFITEVPTPFLDACLDAAGCDRGGRHMDPNTGYVIFGQCDNATVDLVKQIARKARDERNDLPYDPVKINSITISGIKSAAAPHRRKKTSTTPGGVKKSPANPSPKS